MKCRLIREDLEVSGADPRQTRGQTHIKRVIRNRRQVDRTYWNQGAVISHPEAFRLVQQGCAIPCDQECEEACGMSDEDMAAAQYAYERLTRGIAPDDFAAYDAGYLLGYNPDGSWKPGPNGGQEEYEAMFDEPEEDDDEQ